MEEEFRSSHPISIPAGTAAADPFFDLADDDDERGAKAQSHTLSNTKLLLEKHSFEYDQRRKNAKIRSLALGDD